MHAIGRAVRGDVGPARLAELYERKAEIHTRPAAKLGRDGSPNEEVALALVRAKGLRRQAACCCSDTDDHAVETDEVVEEGEVDRSTRVSAS